MLLLTLVARSTQYHDNAIQQYMHNEGGGVEYYYHIVICISMIHALNDSDDSQVVNEEIPHTAPTQSVHLPLVQKLLMEGLAFND